MRQFPKLAEPQRISLVFIVVGLLAGCSIHHKPHALMVQMCLKNDQGVSDFLNLMQTVAVSEHMNFVDYSAETQEKLKTINAKYAKLATPSSVINVDIVSGDRLVVTADNLDLPIYQVSVDFTGDLPPADTQRFIDVLVPRMREQWEVEVVPAGSSPAPIKTCPGPV